MVDNYIQTGGNGSTYIDGTADTAPPTGITKFIAVSALTATVLDTSAMTSAGYTTNITDFDVDITIPAGTTVYGRFTGLTLVSGTCIAYHDRN